MSTKFLMVQGTASNVGKSIVSAAFCRILKQRGYRVAPFKAQNMSNNSFVTLDGGEIGRAQAVQAEACGLEPSVLFNPILLKPSSDRKAQIIAMGKPYGNIDSIGHPDYQKIFSPIVMNALNTLSAQYEVIVMEGAGSPAEMNLKKRDLVNMNLAKKVGASVVLVGDIDWGGIFAQLVGTYELLDRDEQKLVKAFLINKFRGDKKILQPGLDWIEQRTRKKILGVIPFISDLDLAEEDSITSAGFSTDLQGLRANVVLDHMSGKLRDQRNIVIPQNKLLIDIMWLPRISNFTDFDSFKKEPDVFLRYLHQPDRHTLPDLLILPGTKSTIADLKFLRRSGLADYVLKCHQAGVPILGICGGYQMLGDKILDLQQVESDETAYAGLGIISGVTLFESEKQTIQVKAFHPESGLEVRGYEIHMGRTKHIGKWSAPFEIRQRNNEPCEGVSEGYFQEFSKAGKVSWVMGSYIHGLLEDPTFLRYILNKVRRTSGMEPYTSVEQNRPKFDVYDRLARRVEANIDQPYFEAMLDLRGDRNGRTTPSFR